MKYAFNPADAKSYADMERRREIAKQLTGSIGNPRNVGEGLNAIGSALMARMQTRKADKMRDQFAANPDISQELLRSIYGIPQYRYGTDFHPGGMAIVGEDGPEVVRLPRGAAVQPNPITLAQDDPDNLSGPFIPDVEGLMPPVLLEQFKRLPTDEQLRIYDGINKGMDPAELMGISPHIPKPPKYQDARFLDDQAYQVAQATLTDAINDPSRPVFDEKLTEGQSKDVVYFRRGLAANEELTRLENSLTQMTDSIAGSFGAVGRFFQDADYQQAKRAADEFLAMVLRKDTGAAVTDQEFRFYAPMYIPMPNDKPENIAAKRAAREQFLIGLADASGTARPIMQNTAREIVSGGGATHRFNPATGQIEEITQ